MLEKVNDDIEQDLMLIAERIEKRGKLVYLVGGSVRDIILGKESHDFDLCTNMSLEEIKEVFKDNIYNFGGEKFGTLIIKGFKNDFYEITQFRKDGNYSDGRRPDEVIFCDDAKEDVMRRDFTINGLLYDILKGEVLDYVGGIEDIEKGLIRAIGNPDERFNEDSLRMMRAIRIASKYGFTIEEKTLFSIKKNSHLILNISQERITSEFLKILTSGNSRYGIETLKFCNLLQYIVPELLSLCITDHNTPFHPEGNVWFHTMLMLDRYDRDLKDPKNIGKLLDSPTLALSILLHDIGKAKTCKLNKKDNTRFSFIEHEHVGAKMAEDICERLKLSKDWTKKIVNIIDNHMVTHQLEKMGEHKVIKFFRNPYLYQLIYLFGLDLIGSLTDENVVDEKLNWINNKYQDVKTNYPSKLQFQKLITGYDLLELGLPGGAIYKEILEDVDEKLLKNYLKYTDKEKALKYVKGLIKQKVNQKK